MSRSMSAAMLAAIVASATRPILLFKGEFSTGWIYIWTGIGLLGWDSLTWTGIGELLSVSAPEEVATTQANGLTIQLAGANITDARKAIGEARTGKSGVLYLGMLDTVGSLIADPRPIFNGRMDTSELNGSNLANPLINFQYEHQMVDLERLREWRYTDEHQRSLYGADPSLSYIESIQDKKIVWGKN